MIRHHRIVCLGKRFGCFGEVGWIVGRERRVLSGEVHLLAMHEGQRVESTLHFSYTGGASHPVDLQGQIFHSATQHLHLRYS